MLLYSDGRRGDAAVVLALLMLVELIFVAVGRHRRQLRINSVAAVGGTGEWHGDVSSVWKQMFGLEIFP